MSGAKDQGVEIDIQEDIKDLEHPVFKIKYRSNSFSSYDAASEISEHETLPTVKVLGTGGTIASKGLASHQTAGYQVDLTIEDLVQSIPDLSTTCNLQYEQVMNIDSKDMGTQELLVIYEKIMHDLKSCDAIVITHGTDTMEETAFFLQSVIDTQTPIVMCGSMRPSTAISSDGPMNLYQAIVIAASKESRGRGVLVALNDRIGSGLYITKSNANSLDTFKSVGQGYIGNFVNNEIHYFYPAVKPVGVTYFSLKFPVGDLPEVPIVYAHNGLNNKIIELIVDGVDAKGLVLACTGAGTMSDATNAFLAEISKQKHIPIVYSKRAIDGMIPKGSMPKIDGFDTAIASGYLNPAKSRILLQLCLYQKYSLAKIKKSFKAVYGG